MPLPPLLPLTLALQLCCSQYAHSRIHGVISPVVCACNERVCVLAVCWGRYHRGLMHKMLGQLGEAEVRGVVCVAAPLWRGAEQNSSKCLRLHPERGRVPRLLPCRRTW